MLILRTFSTKFYYHPWYNTYTKLLGDRKGVIERHQYALYYFHKGDWMFNGSHTVDIERGEEIFNLYCLY